MIVPMNKLSVLIYHREKSRILKDLQAIGIVHLEETEISDSKESSSEVLKNALDLNRSCERTIQVLTRIRKEKKLEIPQAIRRGVAEDKIRSIIKEFEDAEQKKETLKQNLAETEKEIKQLESWGEFDPSIIKSLAEKGISIRFFEIPSKRFDSIKETNVVVEVVEKAGKKIKFIAFEKDEKLESDEAQEIHLPIKSLKQLVENVDTLKEELAENEKVFEKLTGYIDILAEFKINSGNTAELAAADANLVSAIEGKLYSLTGWFPANREKTIREFFRNYICYFQIEKPDFQDNVPVMLKNNRFNRLFEPITKIYSLPSYREIDPTPYFAPFFTVYFGLCLGDLGYGFITLLIAFFALLKGPKQFRNFYIIGLILGFMTILSGIALNSFFGESIFYLKGNREYFFRSEIGAMLSFLGSYVNVSKLTVFPAMGFAIFLGVIQVLLGILLQAVNRIRQHGFVWGIHPVSFFMIICGLLLTIGHGDESSGFKGITGIDISTFQLGSIEVGSWLTGPPQMAGIILALAGLLLMFLFNNPDKNFFLRPLMGLWELYGFATGIVGDILSYLRLFALGLASGLLGHAFNGIAFSFIETSIFPGIIGTIALLIFAHALNFGLAILGSFVHPLRLTFVEFYKNLDFEGGGKEYRPFMKEKAF